MRYADAEAVLEDVEELLEAAEKEPPRLILICLCGLPKMLQSAPEEFIGFSVVCLPARYSGCFTFGELDLESRYYMVGNVILQGEDVANLMIVALGPQVTPR